MKKEKPDPDVVGMIDLIDEFLAKSDDSPKQIFKIKELLSYHNYNLRLTELSDEELASYHSCNNSIVLSNQMRATLENCKTEDQKNYYLNMWARSIFILRCEWDAFLHGETNKKPLVIHKKEPAESQSN